MLSEVADRMPCGLSGAACKYTSSGSGSFYSTEYMLQFVWLYFCLKETVHQKKKKSARFTEFMEHESSKILKRMFAFLSELSL